MPFAYARERHRSTARPPAARVRSGWRPPPWHASSPRPGKPTRRREGAGRERLRSQIGVLRVYLDRDILVLIEQTGVVHLPGNRPFLARSGVLEIQHLDG